MTDEQEQKQNLTDAESSKLQNDDSENPWSKQTGASNAQPSSTVVENNKPVSNIYVPPSVIKGEVSTICLHEHLLYVAIFALLFRC